MWDPVLIFFNSKNLFDVPVHLHVSATLDSIAQQKRKKVDQQHGWMPCHRLSIIKIGLPIVFSRDIDILGWFPAGSVLTSWAEGASLAFVGHPSGGGVTIKIPYRGDVLLHRPTLPPIFSTGLVQTDS